MNSRATNLSLCFLAASALIAQMLAVREVLALTGGNEVVVGLVFGAWFFWSGVGAASAGWLKLGQCGPSTRLRLVVATAGWLPLVQVILLRFCAGWLETGDGRLTGTWQAVGAIALLLSPVPFFVGAGFAALAAAPDPSPCPLPHGEGERQSPPPGPLPQGEGGNAVATRFAWDAIGAAVAGVVFTFVLAGRLSAIQTGAVLVPLGIFCALPWDKSPFRASRLMFAVILLALWQPVFVLGWAPEFERKTLRWRPRFSSGHERLLAARDSRYQQLLLTEYRGQFTVYGDGEALATYPDVESTAAEAHFVACQAPQPRRILLAGAAPGSTVRELLRYKPERIDVVEFDPEVRALLWDKLAQEDRAALSHPAVALHTGDVSRFLLSAPANGYDLIWLHPPAPSSIQTNRFYTAEFFQRAARVLSGRGVLTFSTAGAPNYLGPVMGSYLGTIHAAVKEAFPVVRVLPGSHERFLAVKQPGVLPASPEEAVARCAERKLTAPNFAPEIFFTLWEPDQEARRAADFEGLSRVSANRDLQPHAMLAYLRIWDRYAGSASADIGSDSGLKKERASRWPWLGVAAAVALVLAIFATRRFSASGTLEVAVAALSGAAAMAVELALLSAYQAACGFVYERLGLMVGLYMLGLAAGNRWAAGLQARGANPRRTALLAQCALVLCCLCGWLALGPAWSALSPALVEVLVAVLLAAFAVAAGVQLPVLVALAPHGQMTATAHGLEAHATARGIGATLAGDYAGATIGALSTGTLLVPYLGAAGTVLLTAACLVLGLLFLWASQRSSQ